jgi:hypothetical protein
MKIIEEFEIEIHEPEQEYPPSLTGDYRIQELSRGLTAFVQRVSDDHTDSPNEALVVRFKVIKSLLESFQAIYTHELLKERVLAGQRK